ncbi:hypothetical protein VHEMI04074 [[Torrubiella] hemipterigena]|uniref:Uncharacterized protein n=1 Tax=[Torrubiella] hemipterigena TaxID=1531966 RepID=A0A0A1SUB5_9HYPO|nr:hypothetical protein VHEMI04074 [[Torrubiella] hemipterigena]
MGVGKPTPTSSIEQHADMFKMFSISTVALNENKRLVVEVIVGEMADIMERMRYNLLDDRLSPPADGETLDPTTFPRTFDYMHMGNIPDYIGGILTTFLVGRPLLKEDKVSSLRFNNLLNPPEFGNHQTFQSEYLLMHDTKLICQHFLLSRCPGNDSNRNLPPMLVAMGESFLFEDYMIWDSVPRSTLPFQQLLPKSGLEKWIYAHLLKICLPYPRPMFSGAPVYAPLNLSALIRLISDMLEVGYPAHWLLGIFSSTCAAVITTSARPPTQLVTKPADVETNHPAKAISIQPWVGC